LDRSIEFNHGNVLTTTRADPLGDGNTGRAVAKWTAATYRLYRGAYGTSGACRPTE